MANSFGWEDDFEVTEVTAAINPMAFHPLTGNAWTKRPPAQQSANRTSSSEDKLHAFLERQKAMLEGIDQQNAAILKIPASLQ